MTAFIEIINEEGLNLNGVAPSQRVGAKTESEERGEILISISIYLSLHPHYRQQKQLRYLS